MIYIIAYVLFLLILACNFVLVVRSRGGSRVDELLVILITVTVGLFWSGVVYLALRTLAQ